MRVQAVIKERVKKGYLCGHEVGKKLSSVYFI